MRRLVRVRRMPGWTRLYRDTQGVFRELTYPHPETRRRRSPQLESYPLVGKRQLWTKHGDTGL
jgi:hypothetical protein